MVIASALDAASDGVFLLERELGAQHGPRVARVSVYALSRFCFHAAVASCSCVSNIYPLVSFSFVPPPLPSL